jgi:acetolactate synthase-1/2/3 large subunit
MIKVSDYVIKFLENNGVRDVFLISGGGMMHLLDSAGRSKRINIICNLNEQASSICADSYAQYTNELGVCLVTTGPGGTNAVTGVAAAYLDSSPVFAISGQAKTTDLSFDKGVRQIGPQEVDIVSIVKPITKYAITVMDKNEIRYHLEKALFLATHGRRGPVWIDVPLNIQGANIEEDTLAGFDPQAEGLLDEGSVDKDQIKRIFQLISKSKRPVFLAGHGLVASKSADAFVNLAAKLNIPVLTSWRARGLYGDEDKSFFGHPGSPGPRYSNYIIQNSDLLIDIGARLNFAMTAFNNKGFAPNAKKVIVDIDINELNNIDISIEEKVVSDAKSFVDAMTAELGGHSIINRDDWWKYCRKIKEKYPITAERQPNPDTDCVDGYKLADKISQRSKRDDIFIGSSSGRTCGISHMGLSIKSGQRFISSMGLGSMGFTLPSSIAACIASGKKRTIALEGDGSLQHNIQELQLISSLKLPIKLFILSNGGYASIYIMQKNHFKCNYTGCIPENSLTFPDLKELASLYKLDYYFIGNDEAIDSVLDQVMKDDRPVLCKINGSVYFDEIPKAMTTIKPDGTINSSSLENLYPFLPESEVKENMSISE